GASRAHSPATQHAVGVRPRARIRRFCPADIAKHEASMDVLRAIRYRFELPVALPLSGNARVFADAPGLSRWLLHHRQVALGSEVARPGRGLWGCDELGTRVCRRRTRGLARPRSVPNPRPFHSSDPEPGVSAERILASLQGTHRPSRSSRSPERGVSGEFSALRWRLGLLK